MVFCCGRHSGAAVAADAGRASGGLCLSGGEPGRRLSSDGRCFGDRATGAEHRGFAVQLHAGAHRAVHDHGRGHVPVPYRHRSDGHAGQMVWPAARAPGVHGRRRWRAVFHADRQFHGLHRAAGVHPGAGNGKARLQEADVAGADPGLGGAGDHDPAQFAGRGPGRGVGSVDRQDPDRHHCAGSADGGALCRLYLGALHASAAPGPQF